MEWSSALYDLVSKDRAPYGFSLRALSVNRSNIGLMNCSGQYVMREVYLLAKLVYF